MGGVHTTGAAQTGGCCADAPYVMETHVSSRDASDISCSPAVSKGFDRAPGPPAKEPHSPHPQLQRHVPSSEATTSPNPCSCLVNSLAGSPCSCLVNSLAGSLAMCGAHCRAAGRAMRLYLDFVSHWLCCRPARKRNGCRSGKAVWRTRSFVSDVSAVTRPEPVLSPDCSRPPTRL